MTPVPLNVYVCTDHDNFWPVGCASVIFAETMGQAQRLLDAALVEKGLKPHAESGYTLELLSMGEPKAVVLWDGNY